MIFYGVLGRLTKKWCGDDEGTLQNDLLCGEGGMIRRAGGAGQGNGRDGRPHPALATALCEGTPADVSEAMKQVPAFEKQYRDYLEKFGDRCMEELKLESATLFDEPLTLFRSVGQLARDWRRERLSPSAPVTLPSPPSEGRVEGERTFGSGPSSGCASAHRLAAAAALLFGWVLRNARADPRP